MFFIGADTSSDHWLALLDLCVNEFKQLYNAYLRQCQKPFMVFIHKRLMYVSWNRAGCVDINNLNKISLLLRFYTLQY